MPADLVFRLAWLVALLPFGKKEQARRTQAGLQSK
jgi:hypothetical protein